MPYIDFTAKLLEMEDVIVDSIVHDAKSIEIHLHQGVKKCACPSCQSNGLQAFSTPLKFPLPTDSPKAATTKSRYSNATRLSKL